MPHTYTKRLIDNSARRALDDGKILVLVGARQTGKSTSARELLKNIREQRKLILNLDDPFLRDRLVTEEGALIRLMEEKANIAWDDVDQFHLLVDEAQKAPALFEILKFHYDSNPEKLRIIITGSSALAIHDPVAETLAGRARILTLPPFTLCEGFSGVSAVDSTADELKELMSRLLSGRFDDEGFDTLVRRGRRASGERRRWVDTHLLNPLFPEPSTSPSPEAWIRDYLATYLEKDVQSMASIGNVALFRACIRQLAARVGTTLKWETAAQQVGTTSVTLRKYVGLMEQTFNLVRLAPFSVNPVKRIIKAPKFHLIDNGLLWGLRGFEDRRLLQASGMLGAYFESLAIGEITKWCVQEPSAPELRFWRKTAVSEVDLVVSNRGYHIPFEFKLGRHFHHTWLRGLNAFETDHQAVDLPIPYRVIIHMGEPARPDENTYVLPLWMLT